MYVDGLNQAAWNRLLRDRKVVSVRLNRFQDGKGKWTGNPALEFDDGTILRFEVRETEIGRYGVDFHAYITDPADISQFTKARRTK